MPLVSSDHISSEGLDFLLIAKHSVHAGHPSVVE